MQCRERSEVEAAAIAIALITALPAADITTVVIMPATPKRQIIMKGPEDSSMLCSSGPLICRLNDFFY